MGRRAKRKRARTGSAPAPAAPSVPVIPVSALPQASGYVESRYFTGEKFYGGFGPTELLELDYWTLRARSDQLFETNLYARGIIRRLITSEINTGLHLEASPEEVVLGHPEDSLGDWSELTEILFALWGQDPWLCDFAEQMRFGELQATARMEALISGDVLVVLRQHAGTMLPRVQLIKGSAVQTPLGVQPRAGHRIVEGVELDAHGRHAGYWVRQADATSKRLPAFGERSGRRIAWLLYGTEKRLDAVRGTPFLSLMLQALREIDRYRDSTLRKAVVNSMLAMFIEKTEQGPGTLPMTGGAVRKDTVSLPTGGGSSGPRRFNTADHIPGLVLDELAPGETPKVFPTTGTVENFGEFEEAIVQTIAWSHNIPPEILRLSFSSNYSASQAANNEFKSYLDVLRATYGGNFCQHIYVEWLLAMVLAQKIEAPGLLDAWRDSKQYDVFAAWTAADWSGHIKPSVKLSDLAAAYKLMIAEGLITRDRAARELTGTKYSKNAKKLRRENEELARALEPIGALASPNSGSPTPPAREADEDEEDDEKTTEERAAS